MSSPSASSTDSVLVKRPYWREVNFLGTVAALGLSSICAYLGWVLPANALLLINADIGPDPAITWLALVWTLSVAISYTLLGRLSDICGRRWFFIGGNIIGMVGTIIGATATSIKPLIGANALIGFAASCQLSFSFAIGELVPNKHRGMWISALFAVSTPVAAFGPVIARSLVVNTAAGWRWFYYLNLIVTGLSVVLFYFFYHPPTFKQLRAGSVENLTAPDDAGSREPSRRSQLLKSDFVGIFLFTAGLCLFILGLSWGGQSYPWKSAHVISTIVIGALALVALGVYETHSRQPYPLLPAHLFKARGYVPIITCATVGSMIYYSLNILWPQQAAALYTTDPMFAGWLSCTVGAGALLGQICGGGIIKYFGHAKWMMIISSVAMTGMIGGMAGCDQNSQTAAVVLTLVGSFFVGVVELAAMALAPLVCKKEDIGLATGVLGSVRSAGGTIATAIYTTILANRLATTLPANVATAVTSTGHGAEKVPAVLAAVANGTLATLEGIDMETIGAVGAAVKTANSQAYKTVYLASIAFGVCAIIASLMCVNVENFMTDEIAVELGGKKKPMDKVRVTVDEKA